MDGLIDVIKSKLLPIVASSAPVLASVLGGPMAGVAVSLIASHFGIDPKQPQKIIDAIQANPESAIHLKTLEYEHSEMLAKLASEDYVTEVDDRKNARELAGKETQVYKDFLRHMAYLVTIGFFGALIMLFYPVQMNIESKELLSMLIGMLVSKWQTIIDFFYGSSRQQNK